MPNKITKVMKTKPTPKVDPKPAGKVMFTKTMKTKPVSKKK